VIDAVVRSAGVGANALVLDLGAGPGTLTAPLARTGAHVVAIERDPAFVRRLRRRFAEAANVQVVEEDLRVVRFPRRRFHVVASIPFALSTVLLGRLLDPDETALCGADLVVEWGFARRVSEPRPRTSRVAWWGARFDMRVARRIPREAFAPAPSVDAAHLVIRRRPAMASTHTRRVLRQLLTAGYRDPNERLRRLLTVVAPMPRARSVANAAGLPPSMPAGLLTVADWARLAEAVTSLSPTVLE
jgi:23S rRNA (adenine-N6)-dimethyltransferase